MLIVIDPDLKKAFNDLFSENPVEGLDTFQHGATVPLEVCIARRIPNPQTPRVREPISLTGWSLRAALGNGFLLPVAGTWTITFGANTTAVIPFNPTAAEIETALNAIASIVGAGGVQVEGENGFFTIVFGSNGDRDLLVGNITNLAPLSVADFGVLIEGTAGRAEVQVLRLVQNPGAFTSLTVQSDTPAAGVLLLQTGSGGFNAKVRVSLTMRSSGLLQTGGIYRIERYEGPDDFENIGGTNVTGDVFTATGTTPATWTNRSVLSRVNARQPYDGQFSITVRGIESAMMDFDADEATVQETLENITLNNGFLVIGAKYKIVSYLGTDDFTNVGAASNATGVVFLASGDTPTDWTGRSVLTPVGVGNVAVSKEDQGQYLVSFQGDMADQAMGTITADGSGLRFMSTLSGMLDLRTAGIDLMLGSDTSIAVDFELEGTPPEESVQKLFRQTSTLEDSLFDPSNTVPPNVVAYALKTVAGKYRFKDDGTFQLWNADQNLFHSITIAGAAGAEVINIGAGEA